jgi:hypothetical protein
LELSQSKSEDNWALEILKDAAASETFKLTREEAREIKKLKRNGFKDFANAYCEYLQLEKQEGSLDYSLKEFCESKGVQYRPLK